MCHLSRLITLVTLYEKIDEIKAVADGGNTKNKRDS